MIRHFLRKAARTTPVRVPVSIAVASLLAATAAAATVSELDARVAATRWIEMENRHPEGRLHRESLRVARVRSWARDGRRVGWVVDLSPAGYMLMPASTCAPAVLYISFSGSFDRASRHPFLDHIGRSLADIADADPGPWRQGSDGCPEKHPSWVKLLGQPAVPIEIEEEAGPLIRSQWEQHEPFNRLLPAESAEVTSFLVSVAQLMYFHHSPERGQGVHVQENAIETDDGFEDLRADFDRQPSWDVMQDRYSQHSLGPSSDAVARLVADLAVAFETYWYRYDDNGDLVVGATYDGAPPWVGQLEPLVRYYGYSPTWSILSRVSSTQPTDAYLFQTAILSEIALGRPVLAFHGRPSTSAAWAVVDGYRETTIDSQIHLNFGDEYLEDGYYHVGRDPDSIEIPELGWGGLGIVIGIGPPPSCDGTARIIGSVTDADGLPVDDVAFLLYPGTGNDTWNHANHLVAAGWTDDDGRVSVECIPPGSYRLMIDGREVPGYPVIYLDEGESFELTADQVRDNVEVSLPPAAFITGEVDVAMAPEIDLEECDLYYELLSRDPLPSTVRDSGLVRNDGTFETGPLFPGAFRLRVFPSLWRGRSCPIAAQWWDGRSVGALADQIELGEGESAHLRISLSPGGFLTGSVQSENGDSLMGAHIHVFDRDQELVGSCRLTYYGAPNNQKMFQMPGLPPTEARVLIVPPASEVWFPKDQFQWYQGASSFDEADPVDVGFSDGGSSAWIWTRLERTDTRCRPPIITRHPWNTSAPDGWAAIVDAEIDASEPVRYQWFEGDRYDRSRPIQGGNQPTLQVEATGGPRKLWLEASNDCGSAASGLATVSPLPAISLSPTRVTLEVGETRELVIEVSRPVGEDLPIWLESSNPALVSVSAQITLPASTRQVKVPVLAGSTAGQATVTARLPVRHGADTAAAQIDVIPVGGCRPQAGALCLSDSRFRLQLDWQAPDGRSGTGSGVPLTRDTGYFWFFRQANVEIVVKVLDGAAVNGHFWVFFAGLSDLAYRLTVTDTVTGEEIAYDNPAGTLASVADVTALPAMKGLTSSQRLDTAPSPAPGDHAVHSSTSGSCTPGPARHCLGTDGRFAVEVEWSAPDGRGGDGSTFALTDDTGAFWFLRQSNLELVVKILDGRPVNGHFWVFFASMTDLPFQLTVTDTQTGDRQVYVNPPGTLQSVADTGAF